MTNVNRCGREADLRSGPRKPIVAGRQPAYARATQPRTLRWRHATRCEAADHSGGSIMAIAPTLQRYLDQTVTYDVIPHEPTLTSQRTAQICHISGDRLAKGIVL